jgi:hypothetical protein
MNTKKYLFMLIILSLAILVAGCAPAMQAAGRDLPVVNSQAKGKIKPVQAGQENAPAAVTPSVVAPVNAVPAGTESFSDATPEGTAVLFYREYIERSNLGLPTLGSPDFQARIYLSQAYLRQIDEIRAGFEGGGYDPILKAQMLPPGEVQVKESWVDGDQAEVVLQWIDPAIQGEWTRSVSLERIDGAWMIVPDRVGDGGLSPEATLEAFYAWYLDYIGGGMNFRNPLVDKAYQNAPYLHPVLVHKIDQLLSESINYDPFLCAQDIPQKVEALATFYNQGRPVVLMDGGFPGHTLTADLVRVDFNQWAIRDITCGITPEGAAKGFYTWALGYMTQDGELHNPWVDRAYQDSIFLSQAFIQGLDQVLDSGEGLPYDPVLLAQDLPQAFNTQPCPEPNCALVNLQYGESIIRQLRIEMDGETFPPRIAAIRHADGPQSPPPAAEVEGINHWVPLVDEMYGFSLRYPAGWRPKGMTVTDLHTPQEYALMRTLRFELIGQNISPFYLDVLVGDQEMAALYYPGIEQGEAVEINGNSATRYLDDAGNITYLFQHPTREDTWLAGVYLGDDSQANGEADIFKAMLSTLTFIQ